MRNYRHELRCDELTVSRVGEAKHPAWLSAVDGDRVTIEAFDMLFPSGDDNEVPSVSTGDRLVLTADDREFFGEAVQVFDTAHIAIQIEEA